MPTTSWAFCLTWQKKLGQENGTCRERVLFSQVRDSTSAEMVMSPDDCGRLGSWGTLSLEIKLTCSVQPQIINRSLADTQIGINSWIRVAPSFLVLSSLWKDTPQAWVVTRPSCLATDPIQGDQTNVWGGWDRENCRTECRQ